MDSERQRTTSRGRPIPSYLPASPLDGLRSPSKPSDERHEPISSPIHTEPLSMLDDNYEPPDDDRYNTQSTSESEVLKDIRKYIQDRGFNTIFDVLDAELRELKVQQVHYVSRQERELRKWLHDDGPSAILSLYVQHYKLELSTSVKECITQLFTRILSQEVSNVLQEKSLRRRLQDYKMDTDFSFDTMASTFAASMPSLSAALHIVFTPDSKVDTAAESSSSAPKKTNDPLVLLENPQSSTSEIRSGPKNPPNHGSGSSEVPIHTPSDSTTMSRVGPHQIQGRNLMINTTLAILCYAKSSGVNLLQGYIGYFLYASKTPKRVIEPLHQLDLSVTYESIIQATKAMTEDTSEQLRNWKFHVPATFAVFDNLNYYSRTRDQRLHNQPGLLNYTACYVAYNPQTRLKRQLLNSDVQ